MNQFISHHWCVIYRFSTALITIAATLVPVAATEDGKAYLSPKAVCDSLGIDWKTQHRKIMDDIVLSSCVVEMTMQVGGQGRNVVMLPKEMVPGWLFTIKKVHPDIQAKLNRFRLECFVALDTWFNKGLRRNDAAKLFRQLVTALLIEGLFAAIIVRLNIATLHDGESFPEKEYLLGRHLVALIQGLAGVR